MKRGRNWNIKRMTVMVLCVCLMAGCVSRRPEDTKPDGQTQTGGLWNTQAETSGLETPPEYVLKLATTKLEDSNAYQGLELFKETVEQASGGSIRIILYPNGALGDQNVTVQAIELGTIEMGFVPIEATEEIFPKIAVFPAMFLIEDPDQVLRILEGDFGQQLLSELEQETGIVCLDQYLEGMRQVWTTQEVDSLAALSGQVIRVPQLPLFNTVFQSLGVTTSFMPLSQVYDGLRTKLLTGIELDAETFLDYNLYEVCKYGLQTNHTVTIYSFMIQAEVLESMTEEQQALIRTAAREASRWMREQHEKQMETIYHELEEKGVKVAEPADRNDPDRMAAIEETLMKHLEGYITPEELKALRSY